MLNAVNIVENEIELLVSYYTVVLYDRNRVHEHTTYHIWQKVDLKKKISDPFWNSVGKMT